MLREIKYRKLFVQDETISPFGRFLTVFSGLIIPALLGMLALRNFLVFGPITIFDDRTLEVWLPFRDMAYLYYFFMLIALAVYVMFTSKKGKFAMSLLKSAVLGILLTTFSFPFAGILFDLSFVVTHLLRSS